MAKIRQNKFSGNQYWTNVLWQVHQNNIIPLSGPKFLWDARFPSSVILNDSGVDQWLDLYQNMPLFLYFGEDDSKSPSYADSTISFNGVNNYLANGEFSETSPEFTIIMVASNLQQNLADDPGTMMFFSAGGIWTADNIGMNQLGFTGDNIDLGVFVAQPIQAIVIQSVDSGSAANVWVNGGVGSNTEISGTSALGFLQIGAFLGEQYLSGNISWIGYYDSAISNSEIDTALTYLSQAFSIPVSPVS